MLFKSIHRRCNTVANSQRKKTTGRYFQPAKRNSLFNSGGILRITTANCVPENR
ncbi:hypothetical protein KCP71_03300 [Salmonella enterica subsp. enterica]|nr:hypothetical protein KCP71_03300 [Salmonella enterica subsp. enterica]